MFFPGFAEGFFRVYRGFVGFLGFFVRFSVLLKAMLLKPSALLKGL